MSIDRTAFAVAVRELGLEPTESQLTSLFRYGDLVREWNARVNLVSRRDIDRIMSYHVLDSLAVSPLVPADCKTADIGTGAGLPGIPLAVVRPDISVTLVDSTRKKCLFLETAAQELELGNVEIVNRRAEELPSLGSAAVLSRLTAGVERVVREAAHHVAQGGNLVLFKTPESAAELEQARTVLGRYRLSLARVHDVELPVIGITRRFVVLRAG